jgi:hypothetical protein
MKSGQAEIYMQELDGSNDSLRVVDLKRPGLQGPPMLMRCPSALPRRDNGVV